MHKSWANLPLLKGLVGAVLIFRPVPGVFFAAIILNFVNIAGRKHMYWYMYSMYSNHVLTEYGSADKVASPARAQLAIKIILIS